MDEPLHVLVSASDRESLNEAVTEVNNIFSKPDHARRLIEQYSVECVCVLCPLATSGDPQHYLARVLAQHDRATRRCLFV